MRIALTFMTDNIPTLSIGWYQFSHIELNDTVSGVCMCTHSERMPQRSGDNLGESIFTFQFIESGPLLFLLT